MQLVKNSFFKYFRDSWKYRYRAIVSNILTSSCLYIGITLAILSLSGKMPVVRDWFIISVMELDISYLICLSILTYNPSCPQLDWFLNRQ